MVDRQREQEKVSVRWLGEPTTEKWGFIFVRRTHKVWLFRYPPTPGGLWHSDAMDRLEEMKEFREWDDGQSGTGHGASPRDDPTSPIAPEVNEAITNYLRKASNSHSDH